VQKFLFSLETSAILLGAEIRVLLSTRIVISEFFEILAFQMGGEVSFM